MSDDLKVDWGKPIEAYHDDGRVVAMKVAQLNAGDYERHDHWLATADGSRFPGGPGSHNFEWAHRDGDLPNAAGWRIRNVAELSDPSGQLPAPSDDIAKRMEALVRKCHSLTDYDHPLPGYPFIGKATTEDEQWLADEARAIVALLPEPVDADLVEARRIAANIPGVDREGILACCCDMDSLVRAARAAIRRGRALERDSREG